MFNLSERSFVGRLLRVALLALLVAASGCAATWSQEVNRRVERYAAAGAPAERLAYLPLGNSKEFRRSVENCDPCRPTLVFVHGLGASKYRWKDVARVMLVQHGYRVVLVDLLGHGDADKPARADYSPSAQGRRLATLIRDKADLFGDRVVFVAMSYGAVSSLEAVLKLQQMKASGQCAPDVAGVVSVSAPAFYFAALEEAPNTLRYLKDPRAGLVSQLMHPRFFERAILDRASWHDERILEADREEVREDYGKPETRRALRTAALHMIEELKDRKSQYDHFEDVDCPVMVVGGAQDEIVPTWVQKKLADCIPGADLELVNDCGHAVQQDQPTLFVESLVRFLDNLP